MAAGHDAIRARARALAHAHMCVFNQQYCALGAQNLRQHPQPGWSFCTHIQKRLINQSVRVGNMRGWTAAAIAKQNKHGAVAWGMFGRRARLGMCHSATQHPQTPHNPATPKCVNFVTRTAFTRFARTAVPQGCLWTQIAEPQPPSTQLAQSIRTTNPRGHPAVHAEPLSTVCERQTHEIWSTAVHTMQWHASQRQYARKQTRWLSFYTSWCALSYAGCPCAPPQRATAVACFC